MDIIIKIKNFNTLKYIKDNMLKLAYFLLQSLMINLMTILKRFN